MVTASIVLYNTDRNQIETILQSLNKSQVVSVLYVIDNNPSVDNEFVFNNHQYNFRVVYIQHWNSGYGSSHNIGLKSALESGADYHIVLNPDIIFDSGVLEELSNYMDNNPDVGYILPKVVYPSGELQYLCKLLPTPSDLIFRRFLPKTKLVSKKNDIYELRMSNYNKIMNVPCLSGCFMFLNCSILKKNNLFFDERYFMYLEDYDLIRRIHKVSKTIFYPNVTIIHNHNKESYKNIKMLVVHIKSAIKYFNKWGWFYDADRKIWNKEILDFVKKNC